MLRVEVEVEGTRREALVDTGSSLTIVSRKVAVGGLRCGDSVALETMNAVVRTLGSVHISSMVVSGRQVGPRDVQVLRTLPLGVDVIVGLDVVAEFGLSVTAGEGGSMIVKLGREVMADGRHQCMVAGFAASEDKTGSEPVVQVQDSDYCARFVDGKWEAAWEWKEGVGPKICSRPNYDVPKEDQEAFAAEVEEWIEGEILVPWCSKEHGEVKNVLPLMSVRQVKGVEYKVRPVLDFRVLNDRVACLTGDLPTCDERLRQWRVKGKDGWVVDLRRAYLQVRVAKHLWVHQAVRWKGRTYLLTRLGFGLNIAPKVMTAIVNKVLSVDEEIGRVASSYIDDVYVTGDRVMAESVRQHFRRFGLITKEAEKLGARAGVRVLGLRVDEQLGWGRDGPIPSLPPGPVTRRKLHSWIGELVGHYPVAGWLRVACGYLQRCTAAEKIGWDDAVSEVTRVKVDDVSSMLRDLGDPVRGSWVVDPQELAVLWTDASSLAMGAALQIGDEIVEDCAWLRKPEDSAHINISELDAVLRGINLCLKWGIKRFTVRTDSATVFRWLNSVFQRTHKVRTHALAEMLIRRRLDMLRELVVQEQLEAVVELVASAQNRSDQLTRVPKKWLTSQKRTISKATGCSSDEVSGLAAASGLPTREDMREMVTRIHLQHHFGVDRTLELAQLKFGQRASRQLVKSVVSQCQQCARIDPAVTFRWQKGSLNSDSVWECLAFDITHVNGQPYLTCIDCASRFTIWRALRDESAKEVRTHMARIFAEMGPPARVLTDNGTVFRAGELRQLLEAWAVKADFSCAYRAQGNGLVERVHRTIKRMVARSGNSAEAMTFWYNVTKGEQAASPFEQVFAATPRKPGIIDKRQEVERTWTTPRVEPMDDTRSGIVDNPFVVGDLVYLKRDGRCDQPWSGPHRVSEVRSSVGVVLNDDGVSRHVSHLRRVPTVHLPADDQPLEDPGIETTPSTSQAERDVEGAQEPRYPARIRSLQQRFGMDEVSAPIYR